MYTLKEVDDIILNNIEVIKYLCLENKNKKEVIAFLNLTDSEFTKGLQRCYEKFLFEK